MQFKQKGPVSLKSSFLFFFIACTAMKSNYCRSPMGHFWLYRHHLECVQSAVACDWIQQKSAWYLRTSCVLIATSINIAMQMYAFATDLFVVLAVESTKLVIALSVYFLASNEKKFQQKLKFLLRFKGALFLIPPGSLGRKLLVLSPNVASRCARLLGLLCYI